MNRAFEYHGALSPLQDACRRAGYGFMAGLMQAEKRAAKGRAARITAVLWRKIDVVARHVRFVVAVRRIAADKPVLIREFSSVPMAVLFPFLRPVRNRLFFIVNHNLQWALHRPVERAAFRRLGRLGCRFVFWEKVPEDELCRMGIKAEGSVALPHPAFERRTIRNRPGGIQTVGVIGEYRAEKGMDALLERLVLLRWRILIGVPNVAEFRSQSRFADHPRIELRDTAGEDAYRRAIAACDVIVLNHPADAYQVRASGLVADAVAARVPVVGRHVPILAEQISKPVLVGELYDDLDGLEAALNRADERLLKEQYGFKAYCEARSVQALERKLNTL